jgi:FG-GAP-like repeat
VTYTASCTIAASATGTLSNTATVSTPAGVTDPNPGNDSATDTDTLTLRGGCDVNGDGRDEIVTGAGPGGGPHVRVFSLATKTELASFYAYDAGFGGGVFVACGDVDGDGLADIITAAGAGGTPHVRAFSLANGGLTEVASFYAYAQTFTGGVRVAVGDVTGDAVAEIITGAGVGGGPHVRAFSVTGGDASEVASFFAYDPAFPGGVFVAVRDVNGDGMADFITGAGASGGPHVRVFDGVTGAEVESFIAYDPAFTGGVFVGSGI